MPEAEMAHLVRLCVQFYTCMLNGDMHNLRRNWNDLRKAKDAMNWTEFVNDSSLQKQLHDRVLELLKVTVMPNFKWDPQEHPSFLMCALPPSDQKDDGLDGTN